MPLVPKPELYPPGGFSFTDSDGSVHTSTSWDLLAVKVGDYRRLTKREVGEVRTEVYTQACERFPDICGAPAGKAYELDPAVKLGVEVQGWIAGVAILNSKGALKRVSAEEAGRRAAICRACPLNIDWKLSCTSCGKNLTDVAADLARGGPDTQTEGLKGCAAFYQDNAVAVRLELPAKENPLTPPECWRRPNETLVS